ncbi:hypothetical protein SAMN05216371_7647 [Streptomyces sp. TLI_053]|uniref:hypothetical protein n=1 Tax=Streptomyces sp. TLI_053 TaxID=1855352 RepID=UPI000879DA15|nr:hypothetical protein [Streptomyces sp. TLI_053]SDT82840.1 hypothetical protein SAMN05216371_7647 [Streptomyces sp. TLI_053]
MWLIVLAVAVHCTGAAVTTKVAFTVLRNRYLLAGRAPAPGPGPGAGSAPSEQAAAAVFELSERPQAECLSLITGLIWPLSLPALAVRTVGRRVLFAREQGREAAAAAQRHAVCRERIDELERSLGVGTYAAPPNGGPRR